MAGFFPPGDSVAPVTPFSWQTIPFEVDWEKKYLVADESSCPRIAQERKNVPPPPVEWLQRDKEVLNRVSEFVGMPYTSFENVTYIGELLRSSLILDPEPPTWLVEAFKKTIINYFEYGFKQDNQTPMLQKIKAGPILTEIIGNMEKNQTERQNFVIYSGHDDNLYALTTALNVHAQVPFVPNYADSMQFELVDKSGKDGDDLEVRIKYISFTNADEIMEKYLDIPGCQSPCRLTTLKRVLERYWVDDFAELCKV